MAHVVDRGKRSQLRWQVRYRTNDGSARSKAFAAKAGVQAFALSVESQKASGSHSLMQNIRRGHYELGVEARQHRRVETAFSELAHTI